MKWKLYFSSQWNICVCAMKATTIIETGKQFLVFTLNVDLPSHHCSIPSVTTHHSSELSLSQWSESSPSVTLCSVQMTSVWTTSRGQDPPTTGSSLSTRCPGTAGCRAAGRGRGPGAGTPSPTARATPTTPCHPSCTWDTWEGETSHLNILVN